MRRRQATGGVPGAEQVLIIERVFDAPRELVWKAWTDRKHAQLWWGPKGLTVGFLEMDVRPGGAWRKLMRAVDGAEYVRSGVFREIVEPERLVFTYVSDDPFSTLGHETLVTVTLAEFEGKTKLTLRQGVFESIESRDSHRGGWNSALERLGEYLETVRASSTSIA